MDVYEMLEICMRFIAVCPIDPNSDHYSEILEAKNKIREKLREMDDIREAYGRDIEAMQACYGYPFSKVKGEK